MSLVGVTAWLCFRAGGFFDEPRTGVAIGAWVGLALAALAGFPVVPRSRPAQVALGSLVGLAGWTAASVAWAPLLVPARSDAVRVTLYAGVLWLAYAVFRDRRAVRSLEAALASLSVVVVGYGLLGKVGLLDLTESVSAAGRLEQPLSYWNAMGTLAALGAVLSLAIVQNPTRASAARATAGAAAALLAAGLYLTYSRGALVALFVGVAVLVLSAPWRSRRPGPRRHRAAVVALCCAAAVAGAAFVAVSGSAEAPARGAQAERFADIGSNRGDYWKVALDSFVGHPVVGEGAASFRVAWLRERAIPETVVDAHSLPVETASELGLVGLVLLGLVLIGVVLAVGRVAGADRSLAVGPAAALTVWALHSCLDWDWELPAVTLLAVLLAGAMLAQAENVPDRPGV